jgi:Protein of unknown function (DUF565)
MNYNTKLALFFINIEKNISKKMLFFEIYFAKGVFFLFFGFLLGNLFGSFLDIFRKLIIWDGFIVLIIILFQEFISYFIYKSKKRTLFFYMKNKKTYKLKKNKFFFNSVMQLTNFFILNFFHVSLFLKKVILRVYSIFPKTIKKKMSYFFFNKNLATNKAYQFYILKNLNLFKIGILLGFFIDAFKVGS